MVRAGITLDLNSVVFRLSGRSILAERPGYIPEFMGKVRNRLNDNRTKYTEYAIWNVSRLTSKDIVMYINVHENNGLKSSVISDFKDIKYDAVKFACIPAGLTYLPYRDNANVMLMPDS